jgi:hypothetical protein
MAMINVDRDSRGNLVLTAPCGCTVVVDPAEVVGGAMGRWPALVTHVVERTPCDSFVSTDENRPGSRENRTVRMDFDR